MKGTKPRAARAAADGPEDTGRILVIDDEPIIREVLSDLLTPQGFTLTVVPDGESGLRVLDQGEEFDVVLLDLMLPGIGGFDMLREIKVRDADRVVIMITAYGSIESAVQAMRMGAYDYVAKPFKNEEVLKTVRNGLRQHRLVSENRTLRRALQAQTQVGDLVGKSKVMQDLYRQIDQVAPSRSTVLLEGESGTGKELVAKAIHLKSGRPVEAFVVVNSGSMPADLLESNLFGHVRGAFTGAIQSKKGLFEVAGSGSIFFDEISTVKAEVQAKLLRVIQEKEFLPLGSTQSVHVDVRIIAATNIDLQELVRRGEFRDDLYYRLDVINIRLPPLRDRREDIPLLVDHFIGKYAAENGKDMGGVTPEVLATLMDHSWPGNVRELENVIERAVVLATTSEIGLDLLPPGLRNGVLAAGPASVRVESGLPFYETMERFEREIILETLKNAQGVQRRAAAALGLKATTLNEKIKRLKIQYP